MPLLETLLAMDADLLDWLIDATPRTDDERAKMKEVFVRRAVLDRAINTLVVHRLEVAVANLAEDAARLESAAATLRSVERTIDKVEDVLNATGTAVAVAAKALTFVAGV